MGLLMIINSCLHLKLPALGWQQVSWSHSAKGSVMYVGCWYLLEVCHSAILYRSIFYENQPSPERKFLLIPECERDCEKDCERQV